MGGMMPHLHFLTNSNISYNDKIFTFVVRLSNLKQIYNSWKGIRSMCICQPTLELTVGPMTKYFKIILELSNL